MNQRYPNTYRGRARSRRAFLTMGLGAADRIRSLDLAPLATARQAIWTGQSVESQKNESVAEAYFSKSHLAPHLCAVCGGQSPSVKR